MTVINSAGVPVDFAAARVLMDEELCERLHGRTGTETEQGFFNAYCREHAAKYGEIFEADKENPCM